MNKPLRDILDLNVKYAFYQNISLNIRIPDYTVITSVKYCIDHTFDYWNIIFIVLL